MTNFSRLRAPWAVALLLSLLALAAPPTVDAQASVADQAAPPALVLVVRHAEKVDNSADPVLSAAGIARAEALADALADARVEHVIVSARQRTHLTAVPVMKARGLTAEVVPFGRDMATHVANVAAAARRQAGKVVLIVGHSNTVPAVVTALGGAKMPDLCETRYAALFAVVPSAVAPSAMAPGAMVPGGMDAPARVVVSSFGVPDGPEAMSCAGMSPR